MSDTTNYRVKIGYEVADRATRALGDIDRSAGRAAGSVGRLDRLLMGSAAAVVGSRAIRIAKNALIDFNSSIEDSRVVMAGMLQMNEGGEFEANMKSATQSVSNFQQMAKASALTTKDLVGMAQMIEGPLLQAGAGMARIEQLTFGAANAAKAFQIPAEMAALDIQQAINGTLSSKDRFAKSMLSQKGIEMESDDFNKLKSSDRLNVLSKALGSDAIKKMAQAQSETMNGVMSTLQDNIQMTAGRIGLPLFKAITKEIKSWNNWIDANQVKVDRFVATLADGLSQAFGYLRSAVGFIVDHADTMIMIAKVWAAAKVGSMVGNAVGGVFGADMGKTFGQAGAIMAVSFLAGIKLREGLSNLWDYAMEADDTKGAREAAYKRQINGADGKQILASFSNVRDKRDVSYDMLLGGNYTQSQAYQKDIANIDSYSKNANSEWQEKYKQERLVKMKQLEEADTRLLFYINEVRQTQTTNLGQSIDILNLAIGGLSRSTDITRDGLAVLAHDLPAVATALLGNVVNPFVSMFGLGDKTKDREMAKPSATNINIAKVEVPAKDPDRWIAELDARVNKQIKAPKSARRALRGGI